MKNCAACGRSLLGKGRELTIKTGPETALFCEDALGCQRTVALIRISPLLIGGATVKSAFEFLEKRPK
jgi:hypothetical protein